MVLVTVCSHQKKKKITLKLVSGNTLVFKNIPCFREGKHTLVVRQEISPHIGRADSCGPWELPGWLQGVWSSGWILGVLARPWRVSFLRAGKEHRLCFFLQKRDVLLPFPAATRKSPTCQWLRWSPWVVQAPSRRWYTREVESKSPQLISLLRKRDAIQS